MLHIRSILRCIVDQPGISASEIADICKLSADHVVDLLAPYVNEGRITATRGYVASPSVVDEFYGARHAASAGYSKSVVQTESADGVFCGFFSDGRLSIVKGGQAVYLTSTDRAFLLDFLGSINMDRVAGVSR